MRSSVLVVVVLTLGTAAVAEPRYASKTEVDIKAVTPTSSGESVAKAEIGQTPKGLEFTVVTWKVPAGEHGFHIHENGSCDPKEKDGTMEAAGAAGGHYDPAETGSHRGPGKAGHKGDLPRLNVAGEGEQRVTFSAPGLTLEEIRDRALVIHEKGDTYADTPPMGGSGKRIACGIIP